MHACLRILSLGILLLIASALAQEGLFKKENVSYQNQRLSEIMQDLATKAGVRIDCPEPVSAKLGPISYKGNQQEIGRIASNMLRPLGYRLNLVDKNSYEVQALPNNDEFMQKRVEQYEFLEEPVITRSADQITIHFTVKAFCDVTVAVERANGKIVRHLASGLLGETAPEPFGWNSTRQILIWDGKDDRGEYVDNKDELTIRISLGLAPHYEKNLFWEPKKRIAKGWERWIHTEDTIPVATPEGVYVYDGNGVDHIRLFDHEGKYVRTVYPFPASKLKDVKGLKWNDYPQGYQRAEMHGLNQTTFLTCGENDSKAFRHASVYSMAVLPGSGKDEAGRIALVGLTLNRISTSGSSVNDLPLDGPICYQTLNGKPHDPLLGPSCDYRTVPLSSAFSPDGKRLYLTGFNRTGWPKRHLDGIAVLNFETNDPLKKFSGEFKMDAGLTPCVVCDKQGRVYVSDYINDCINIFDPDAKFLKKIAIEKPTQICIHPSTGEIYVFSWYMGGNIWAVHPTLVSIKPIRIFPASLTILKSVDDPAEVAKYSLPRSREYVWGNWQSPWEYCHGTQIRASVDFWADKPTIWLTPGSPSGSPPSPPWEQAGLILLQASGKELKVIRDFGNDTVQSVVQAYSCRGHQRLYTNPINQKLYISESNGGPGGGAFSHLVEVNPDDGTVKIVNLPLSAEDLTFDIEGMAYLRQFNRVLRFNAETWKEVAWDYGEEQLIGNFKARSSLELPSSGTVCASEGGLYVSPKGHLAVSCSNNLGLNEDRFKNLKREGEVRESTKPYKPSVFPGRINNPVTACVHVWDKKGRLICEDAVPGMTQLDGLGIDTNDNIYGMSAASRIYGGTKYANHITGTLFKVPPGHGKWLSDDATAIVPMSKSEIPTRNPDLYGYLAGTVWIEGVRWLYGGVGNCSFKIATGCICWQQSRFALDYFARSFAPEVDQFSVAVIDSNGNLITRIGKYGNVDDGLPLSKDPRLTAPYPRSIGGDEVSLAHASYVATFTDKYLYIGDVGNARVVQVKLGYAAEKRIPLKTVADHAANP